MKIKFSKLLHKHFDKITRWRGEEYFLQLQYSVPKVSPTMVRADVQGTRVYDVILRWNLHEQDIDVSCDCPAFTSYGPCKHIWCMLLFADTLPFSAEKGWSSPSSDWEHNQSVQSVQSVEAEKIPRAEKSHANKLTGKSQQEDGLLWLDRLIDHARSHETLTVAQDVREREVWYVLDCESLSSFESDLPKILFFQRVRRKNGKWGVLKEFPIDGDFDFNLLSDSDRVLVPKLMTAMPMYAESNSYYRDWKHTCVGATVSVEQYQEVFSQIQETNRFIALEGYECSMRNTVEYISAPFTLKFRVSREGKKYQLDVLAVQDANEIVLNEDLQFYKNGLVYIDRKLMHIKEPFLHWQEVTESVLAFSDPIPLTLKEDLHRKLLTLIPEENLQLPQDFSLEYSTGVPQAILQIDTEKQKDSQLALVAQISFLYQTSDTAASVNQQAVAPSEATLPAADAPVGGPAVAPAASTDSIEVKQKGWPNLLFGKMPNSVCKRDMPTEEKLIAALKTEKVHFNWLNEQDYMARLTLAGEQLQEYLTYLMEAGWQVKIQSQKVKTPSGSNLKIVGSGTDWFEVMGEFNVQDQTVTIQNLLAALRENKTFFTLNDGSLVLPPQKWLKTVQRLLRLGEWRDEKLMLHARQHVFLEDVLSSTEETNIDANLLERFSNFQKLKMSEETDAPAGFTGKLRPYQRKGLAWLQKLQAAKWNGCLADDMGLGKTVQVLAFLCGQKAQGNLQAPALIVVPKSLLTNWQQEAAKFTPMLRFQEYSGSHRKSLLQAKGKHRYDCLVMTYNVLLRDIAELKQQQFSFFVLDEAQSIKNKQSQIHRAVCTVPSQMRIALSGTPIENHLRELVSIFDFLNPGMLGKAFKQRISSAAITDDQALDVELLQKGLAPFILRRNKNEVLPDLPDKIEKYVYCELPKSQRDFYENLRLQYRKEIESAVEDQGYSRVKLKVLEALLRLRQAACHPGLVDKARRNEGSAKLDDFLSHLSLVLAEGHRALVFSQFTQFLSLIAGRLDIEGIPYYYLDGKTRNRQELVDRFQSEKGAPVFLISLKAGGVGLNLTNADYCFLLDPWWNPAVEKQAIDRAHRIGQHKQVFAYRFVGKDTVEEKILQLQDKKRALFEQVIEQGKSSTLGSLEWSDVQELLS